MTNTLRQTLIDEAIHLARVLHGTQKRKYTGEPYVNHCIEVVNILKQFDTEEEEDKEMFLAAALHDTLEDCKHIDGLEKVLLTSLRGIYTKYYIQLNQEDHKRLIPPEVLENLTEIAAINTIKLVREVTDVSTPEMGNRAKRREADREHLSHASYEGVCIKLADIISNTKDIVTNDAKFARVYIPEMEALLEVLGRKVNDRNEFQQKLYEVACSVVKEAKEKVNFSK